MTLDSFKYDSQEAYSYVNPEANTMIRQLRDKMNDVTTIVLLDYVVENMSYYPMRSLQLFLDNELYSYPLEWSLPVLDALVDKHQFVW